MTWTCPYCGGGYPDPSKHQRMLGGGKLLSETTSLAVCAVCKKKHRICDRCVSKTGTDELMEVFWDKPGGDMKVRVCADALAVLNAIEGSPPRTLEEKNEQFRVAFGGRPKSPTVTKPVVKPK